MQCVLNQGSSVHWSSLDFCNLHVFLCCGVGKETVIWILSDTRVKSKREQARRRPWLILRGAEGKEGVNNSWVGLRGSAVQLVGLTWPGLPLQMPVCVFTTVCDADRAKIGSGWDVWGRPDEVCVREWDGDPTIHERRAELDELWVACVASVWLLEAAI